MIKIILNIFGLLNLLSFAYKTYAQDSIKTIILSKEVGNVVDSEERKKYNIFPTFSENFVSGYFYQNPDSQYFCQLKLMSGSSFQDSIIKYNYVSIRNIAARIQYQESQKTGKTDFDLDNVVLVFADGSEVKEIASIESSIILKDKKPPSTLRNLPINKLEMDYSEIIEKKFIVGISAGIVHNSADFEGLKEIFNLLEENIPEDPYQLPKSNLSFKASPIYRFSSLFIYNNKFMFEIIYSISPSNDELSSFEYESFSGSLGYMIQILRNLSPYISLGYSASKFTASNHYGSPVNDRQGTLESITLEGNVKGLMTSLGIFFNISQNFGINLLGNYKFYSDVSVNSQYYVSGQTIPTVDAKGFEFGLSIYFTN
jgi:hypothetical protein